jgi:hypothetical protein
VRLFFFSFAARLWEFFLICLPLWLAYDSDANRMSNEAERSRRFVVPKPQAAGWENEPQSIAGQCLFLNGLSVIQI